MVSSAQKKGIRRITYKLIKEQDDPTKLSLRVVKENVIELLDLPGDFFDKQKNDGNRQVLKGIVDEVLSELDDVKGKTDASEVEEKSEEEEEEQDEDEVEEEREEEKRGRKRKAPRKQVDKRSSGAGEDWTEEQASQKENLKKIVSQLTKGPSMYRKLSNMNSEEYLRELTRRIIDFCHKQEIHSANRLPNPNEIVRFKQEAARKNELEGLDLSNIIKKPKRTRQMPEEMRSERGAGKTVSDEEEEDESDGGMPTKKKKETSDSDEEAEVVVSEGDSSGDEGADETEQSESADETEESDSGEVECGSDED
eukprot:GHVS01091394.1.p1 GENE.GHVS01091394.1~~GHVS01091394.1.p1  ORF type:complete len:342 (+),score=71.35 GHVS01091394.1:98-1027(+)